MTTEVWHIVTRPYARTESQYHWNYPKKPRRDEIISVRLQQGGRTVDRIRVPVHIMQRFKLQVQRVRTPWVFDTMNVVAHEAQYSDLGLEVRVFRGCRNLAKDQPDYVFSHYRLLALEWPFVRLQKMEYPHDIDYAQELWPVGGPVVFNIS